MPYLTAEQRQASLDEMLAHWSDTEPLWVFGYGSLIWRPEFRFDSKTCGIVYGFHRSLCLWSHVYRGTPEQPGLVLGLEPGGCCRGVAFRIPKEHVRDELKILWQREMMTGSYTPRWLDIRMIRPEHTERIKALGFVMNRRATGYAGELDRDTLLRTLRTARGERGTSAEYLLSTVQCLNEHGIRDRHLAALADEVGLALSSPADHPA